MVKIENIQRYIPKKTPRIDVTCFGGNDGDNTDLTVKVGVPNKKGYVRHEKMNLLYKDDDESPPGIKSVQPRVSPWNIPPSR